MMLNTPGPTYMVKLFIVECLLFRNKSQNSRIIGILCWMSILVMILALWFLIFSL